jgi:hypothetical protein
MNSEDNSTALAAGQELLRQLAIDLRWSWNHATDELWRRLEPELWAATHNPWVVLQTVSPQRLALMTYVMRPVKAPGFSEATPVPR